MRRGTRSIIATIYRACFWRPPRRRENSAQTVVRVLGNLVRSAVSSLGLLAAVVGSIILFDFLFDDRRIARNSISVAAGYASTEEAEAVGEWLGTSRGEAYQELQRRYEAGELAPRAAASFEAMRLERQADIVALFDATDQRLGVREMPCPSNYPILVEIRNDGQWPITNVIVYVDARRPNRSSSVFGVGGAKRLSFDAIVEPGSTWGRCISVDLLDAISRQSVWSATVRSAERWRD